MAISRQAQFPSLIMTVALIVGFAPAAYTQDSRIYTFCDSDNVARVNPASFPFIIQSPNFGSGLYSNNINCSFTIASDEYPVVATLYFRYFDVENEHLCGNDFLIVNGVKYCGSWEARRTLSIYLQGNSASTLRFKTNSSGSRPGFQIVVITEYAGGLRSFMGREDDMPVK